MKFHEKFHILNAVRFLHPTTKAFRLIDMERFNLSPSKSRRIAIFAGVFVILFQVFADQTIATERKAGAKTYPAKETLQKSQKPVVVPAELLAIEKKYLNAKTLEADFSQKDEVKLTGMTKDASGILMIRHPNQFRWETLKPDKNLLVSNGKKFWFYTPPFEAGERGQVIEKKTNEVQSDLANHVLSGAFSKIQGVEIQRISATRFKLVPAAGVAGTVKTAELEIDPKNNLIQQLTLEHAGGNRTQIRLSNIKFAGKMNDGYFRFVTPPGTDVLRE